MSTKSGEFVKSVGWYHIPNNNLDSVQLQLWEPGKFPKPFKSQIRPLVELETPAPSCS